MRVAIIGLSIVALAALMPASQSFSSNQTGWSSALNAGASTGVRSYLHVAMSEQERQQQEARIKQQKREECSRNCRIDYDRCRNAGRPDSECRGTMNLCQTYHCGM
jgi:hypothetical protein